MMRRSLHLLMLFALGMAPLTDGASAGDAQRNDLEKIGALISAAQGTYPASQLPLMCVSIHQATAAPEQNLALLRKLGVSCARSDNNWNSIETGAAPQYDWRGFDGLWQVLCRANIKPIMIATYNNAIYAAGVFRPIAGAPDIEGFKNFAVAMAGHYAPLCPHMAIELFNEPNAVNWTTTPWSGGSYAAMLAPVSAAIKAAQPRVTVYSGGIGFDPHEPDQWITQMVSAGHTFPAVDAYALHPYNYDEDNPANTLPPEQLLADADHFTRQAAATGKGKPTVLTEYGFPLQAVDGDLTRQGIYAARGMLAAIIGRYPVQTYYDLIDDAADQSNRENTFGLFRNEAYRVPYEMKPAGLAFHAIMQAMTAARTFTISYDPATSTPMIDFEKPAGHSFVVWTYDRDAPKSFSRRIGSFSQVSCKDVFGKARSCHYANESLSISLTEADGPIVITAMK